MDQNITASKEGEFVAPPHVYSPPSAHIPPQYWQAAFLKDLAESLFTKGSIPPKNKMGNRIVYYCAIPITPTNIKVVIASGFDRCDMHIVTPTLALGLLEDCTHKLKISDQAILNSNMAYLKL